MSVKIKSILTQTASHTYVVDHVICTNSQIQFLNCIIPIPDSNILLMNYQVNTKQILSLVIQHSKVI